MKKKIMGLWIACICAVSMLFTSTVSRAEVIHETDLEKYILEEMSAAHVLGMSISIVTPNKELYCAAYGQAQNTDVDYVLGGLTKSLTATAVLHMAEVKDLALDDTVADYLPEYQAVGDVTLRELLYQTSGIAPEERMSDLQGLGTRGEFADANANYNLLGMIIEKVSGISYEEYISDTILDTLEMESTYSKRNDTGMDGTLLPAYQGYFGFPFAAQYTYDMAEDWMQVPSGQMISDVKDMGSYLQFLLNHGGELLLGDSVEQLLYGDIPVPDTDGKMFGGSASGGMGGWLKKEVEGQTMLYSTGVTENYNTVMVLLPEKELGIVMMCNSTDFLVGQQLINTLQEGIVSIELEKDPAQIDRDIYLTWHGIADVIMVLLVLAAWMPILLMGVWCKRRRKKLFSIPGILMDILIQLVLPTALLLTLPDMFPLFLIKRMTPDIYYVGLTIILTLYLGAVIKVIAMVILKLLPPAKEEIAATEETAEVADELPKTVETATVKAASTSRKRDRMLETVRTGVLEESDMVGKPAEKTEKTSDKTSEKAKVDSGKTEKPEKPTEGMKEGKADSGNAEKAKEKSKGEKTDSEKTEKPEKPTEGMKEGKADSGNAEKAKEKLKEEKSDSEKKDTADSSEKNKTDLAGKKGEDSENVKKPEKSSEEKSADTASDKTKEEKTDSGKTEKPADTAKIEKANQAEDIKKNAENKPTQVKNPAGATKDKQSQTTARNKGKQRKGKKSANKRKK